mmetsp:Transcript_30263/g.98876  ORF Transcript_30263/g.98876 Transcript_30263/m.98876 type:complete len:270 (+) Transcript_30263:729-1538(+)
MPPLRLRPSDSMRDWPVRSSNTYSWNASSPALSIVNMCHAEYGGGHCCHSVIGLSRKLSCRRHPPGTSTTCAWSESPNRVSTVRPLPSLRQLLSRAYRACEKRCSDVRTRSGMAGMPDVTTRAYSSSSSSSPAPVAVYACARAASSSRGVPGGSGAARGSDVMRRDDSDMPRMASDGTAGDATDGLIVSSAPDAPAPLPDALATGWWAVDVVNVGSAMLASNTSFPPAAAAPLAPAPAAGLASSDPGSVRSTCWPSMSTMEAPVGAWMM